MNCIKMISNKKDDMSYVLKLIESLQTMKQYYEETGDYNVIVDMLEVFEGAREKAYMSNLIDEIDVAQDGGDSTEEERLEWYRHSQEKLEKPSKKEDTSDVYKDFMNKNSDLENKTYIDKEASGL